MTEPIDEITRSLGAGFIEGVNRSRSITGLLQNYLQGVDAADEAAQRAALNRVRIGSELLSMTERTQRHHADLAAKGAENQRRNAKHNFDIQTGIAAHQRGERLNDARVRQVGRLDRKIQLEAFLDLLQDQRRHEDHLAKVALTSARTDDVKTQTGLRLADFEARDEDRVTERAQKTARHDATLDLTRNRDTREQQLHELKMKAEQQRIDIAARAAGLYDDIARNDQKRRVAEADVGAFAAAEGSADQGARQRERAQHYEQRFAADAGTDAAADTASAEPAPDPDLAERVAAVAEEVTVLHAVHDLATDPGSDPAAETETGAGIGDTLDAAFTAPSTTAEADVTAVTDPAAPGPGIDIDTGPQAQT